MFLTAGGRIGHGPAATKIGDSVVAFNKASIPHLIREVWRASAERVYRLVGEAFVSGMMRGEVEKLENLEEQDFHLV